MKKKKANPRRWQDRASQAIAVAIANGKRDILIGAGVGAGKTFFAVREARDWLTQNPRGQIIVVTNTDNLVSHWAEEFICEHIAIKEIRGNAMLEKGLPADVKGYVTTYQSLASWPDLHASFCGRKPTFFIFDEVHHLCDEGVWGSKAAIACQDAKFRLSLSGTLFRSKADQRISFCQYDQIDADTFVIRPDYSISFGRCVAEGYCRKVVFEHQAARVKFRHADNFYDVSFRDPLSEDLWNTRLRYANWIDQANRAIEQSFINAQAMLRTIQDQQPEAGGLVIANDISHAEHFEELITRLTGRRPVLVNSEDPNAHRKIKAFSEGREPWLVAIKMVSEGVDIPRLRVELYASVVTSELFFTQAMGRVVRQNEDYPGPSYVFYPADERLKQIAEKIEDEQNRELRVKEKASKQGATSRAQSNGSEREFIGADYLGDGAIMGGQSEDPEVLKVVEIVRGEMPELLKFPHDKLLLLTKKLRQPGERAAPVPPPPLSYQDENRILRDQVQKELRRKIPFGSPKKDYRDLANQLNQAVGCQSRESATREQLKQQLELLDDPDFVRKALFYGFGNGG